MKYLMHYRLRQPLVTMATLPKTHMLHTLPGLWSKLGAKARNLVPPQY
jgi:hypothetical protein